jgi:hypothetical protein
MDRLSVCTKLRNWSRAFDEAISDWEDWLVQAESAYLSGNFLELKELEPRGEHVVGAMRHLYRDRDSLLALATECGFEARHLRELAMLVEPAGPRPLQKLLSSFVPRLRGIRQHTIALWITAFESNEHTLRILRILSTGEENAATYHPGEEQSLGGGQFVNQAA